jgi:hypothetical protein
MRKKIAFGLILAFICPLILPQNPSIAFTIDNGELKASDNSRDTLIVRDGGGGNRSGGNRSGGNRSGGIDRSRAGASGSGRVNHDQSRNRTQSANRDLSANRGSGGIDRSRVGASGSGRINRDQSPKRAQNVDRNQVNNRAQNVDRDRVNNRAQNVDRNQVNNRVNNIDRDQARNRVNNNRDFDLNNDRNFSNRVNRNLINTGNRNVIVNPRGVGWGGSAWGWNRGVAWAPNYGYWGGGFWGALAVGAVATGVTTAVINAANQPNYVIIQQNTPGYTLFDSYSLTQVRCVENGSQVYVFGPQDSLICATPNSLVSAGYYDVDPESLTLIAR